MKQLILSICISGLLFASSGCSRLLGTFIANPVLP